MPEITHREYEGEIPGKWVTTVITTNLLNAADAAWEDYSSTCQICGAAIDDGEQGCPTLEMH